MHILDKPLLLLSCLILSACGYFQFSDTPLAEKGEWVIDFDSRKTGSYSGTAQRLDWHNPRWQMGRNLIRVIDGEQAFNGKALQIVYPKDVSSCPSKKTCVNWPVELGVKLDRLYYGYRFKLDANFDFVMGGKFPGITGGAANSGGRKPNGKDGWSVRMMWDHDGRLVQYVYHPDQPDRWGDVHYFDLTPPIERGEWHTVQTFVQLNTPGQRDGVIESWLDGKKVFSKNNFRFRDIEGLEIDNFQFVSFFGGHGPDWAPVKDEISYIDDVRISLEPPFYDL